LKLLDLMERRILPVGYRIDRTYTGRAGFM